MLSDGGLQRCGEDHVAPAELGGSLFTSQILFVYPLALAQLYRKPSMRIGSLALRGMVRRICLVKGTSIEVVVIREDGRI